MSKNMKGLLKGLRYISQIFEEEEAESEMQIGLPTDVKHVAHIGWGGPSVTSPSWMTEFTAAPGNASSNGENANGNVEELESVSQDPTTKKGVRDSPGRDLPALPKSRRQPSIDSIGSLDSPVSSPTQKNKSTRRRSKHKDKDKDKDKDKEKDRESNPNSPRGGETSNSQDLPNIPKKSRRKKSDSADGSVKSTSSRSKDKSSRHGRSRTGSDDGSISKQFNSGEFNSKSGLVSLKEEGLSEGIN